MWRGHIYLDVSPRRRTESLDDGRRRGALAWENSYTVGLSTEYGLENLCSGRLSEVARYVPEEKRVARGEAVKGSGFRRTGSEACGEAPA